MADRNLVKQNGSPTLRIDNPSTLTEEVYSTLRDEIITGALKPGERLVRRAISQRLGVSPMPVVEALLRLEGDGLVENRPQCGSRVKPLTFEEVQRDQFLREAIECQAARMCAENASNAELAALMTKARLVDRLLPELLSRNVPALAVSKEFPKDIEFHMDVIRCGGCPGLADELGKVWFRRMMRFSWLKLTRYKPMMKDCHQKLVKAFLTRDPELAEATMREHVRYSNEKDREALKDLIQESVLAKGNGSQAKTSRRRPKSDTPKTKA